MTKRQETAFEKGRKDCLANIAMSKNPYRGERRKIWQAGWESIIDEKIAEFKWNSSDMNEEDSVDYLFQIGSSLGIPKEYLGNE